MDYIKLVCAKPEEPVFTEILMADLADIGFESFEETEENILAYIPEKDFEKSKLKGIDFHTGVKPEQELVKDQNWNAVWESNYDSVLIADRVYIRAPFHEHRTDVEFEIVINPKMAFGTAHHETTALIIEYLLEEQNNLQDKTFLDMGCGTGVLAILAVMLGAKEVMAVDNDPWSFESTSENIIINKTPQVKAVLGDAASLSGTEAFDYILANINKNILLNDMAAYEACLNRGGVIWFSGFYESDLEDIKRKAEGLGLRYQSHKVKNSWTSAKFVK